MYVINDCAEQISNQLSEWHKREGISYPLESLLLIILLARCCGKVTSREILDFYRTRIIELVYLIPGLTSCYMSLSESTINRVLANIDPEQLNNFFVTYFNKVRAKITEQIYIRDGNDLQGRENTALNQNCFLDEGDIGSFYANILIKKLYMKEL